MARIAPGHSIAAPHYAQHQFTHTNRSRPNTDRLRILCCLNKRDGRRLAAKRHKEETQEAHREMTGSAPNITCEQHHTGLLVSDLDEAIDFYTNKLGFQLVFKWGEPPTMAGVNLDHTQIFLERGEPSPKGCYLYFVINDADAFYEFHRNNGVEVVAPIADRDYELRDYAVRDLHGYVMSFGHRLQEPCEQGEDNK